MKHKKRSWCTCAAFSAIILNKNVAFLVPLFSMNRCSKTSACILDLILSIMILSRILRIWLGKLMVLKFSHSVAPDVLGSVTKIELDISFELSLCCRFHSTIHTRHQFQLQRQLLLLQLKFDQARLLYLSSCSKLQAWVRFSIW